MVCPSVTGSKLSGDEYDFVSLSDARDPLVDLLLSGEDQVRPVCPTSDGKHPSEPVEPFPKCVHTVTLKSPLVVPEGTGADAPIQVRPDG
eukprot:2472657-Amphidinium_carterae.1